MPSRSLVDEESPKQEWDTSSNTIVGLTFDALLGGAEDVLGDLGVRQVMKQMPKNVKL